MDAPSISIVIPSYNRPERLARCLASLSRQAGGPYETIVVDDGSPQPLADICAAAGSWVRYVRQDNAGPAAARNTGARTASGEFLCFTDDDCLPHPGWARALLGAQVADSRALVGGRVENAFPDNLFAETSQSISDWLYHWHERSGTSERFFTSNNIGCAKQAFLAINGFDESFPLAAGEDRDFGMRWAREAGPLVFAPDAVVGHAHWLALDSFWRQHSNYGRGARSLHGQAPPSNVPRSRFQALSFYAGLMFHPMMRKDLSHGRRAAVTVLTCLSQVAIAKGYLASSR